MLSGFFSPLSKCGGGEWQLCQTTNGAGAQIDAKCEVRACQSCQSSARGLLFPPLPFASRVCRAGASGLRLGSLSAPGGILRAGRETTAATLERGKGGE